VDGGEGLSNHVGEEGRGARLGSGVVELDLYDPRTYTAGIPHEAFATLCRECPVYWQEERSLPGWPSGPGYWAVTRYEDVVYVNRNPDLFSSHLGATQIRDPKPDDLAFQQKMMLNLDPPEHTRLRRIVSKAFTPRHIERLEPWLRAQARATVERVASRGACDFSQDLAADLPLLALAQVMGVPGDDRWLLFEWANRVIGFQDPEYARFDEQGRPIDPRSRAALSDMFEYAHELASHKRRHPGEDIITILLFAEVDGQRLTREEFENFFFLLTVAGNETLRNGIPGGMFALLEHPDEHRRLLENPSLLRSAIEEMLRYAGPVMCFRRTASRDTDLGEARISAGEKVVVYYASANRDKEVFPDPMRFDVARAPNEHLAFGAGPHFCLGAHLARLQMRVFFEEVLWQLPDLELAGPVERLQSNFQSGIKHMPITFTPQPSAR
jgi:cytochrome P450